MIDSKVAEHILLHCDRTGSKEARYALSRFLWEPLNSQQMQLSSDCVLAPGNDILQAQESQKLFMNGGFCKCLLCGKMFLSEHFLDKHLARRHAQLRHDAGMSCLADYCGALVPCVPLTSETLPPVSTIGLLRQDEGMLLPEETNRKAHCSNQRLRRNRAHACEEIIRHCLPDHVSFHTGFSSHGKVSDFREDLCERAIEIDCIGRKDIWSHYGSLELALQGKSTHHALRYGTLLSILLAIFVALFWTRARQHFSDHCRKAR